MLSLLSPAAGGTRPTVRVGPYHAHPAFDCIDRQAYEDLMLIHASHHLGFLVPKDAARA